MFIVSIYDGGYGDMNFYVNDEFISKDEILKDSKLYDIIFFIKNSRNEYFLLD